MSLTSNYEEDNSLLLLREVAEMIAYKIITSTMYSAKTVLQISIENKLPLSSTYKKISRLCKVGILSVERASIDDNGKKVLYYRSKIKAIEACLNESGLAVHVKK
jgi:predicted transcriptional regulator